MCRSIRNIGDVHHQDASYGYESDDVFLGAVGTGNDDPWLVTIQLEGKPVVFHIDTGAEVSVITETVHEEIGSPPLSSARQTLRGPSNSVLPVKGMFSATIDRDGQLTKQDIYVAQKLHKPLLGRPAIQALGLVQRVREVQAKHVDPVQQFPTLFRGLGKLPGEYTIKLQDGAKPYALATPRRVPIPLMKSVKEELERMEKLGVISKINSPTDWCAGMVVVPKSNRKVRICVDQNKWKL